MKRVLFLLIIALAFVACEADQDIVEQKPEALTHELITHDGSKVAVTALDFERLASGCSDGETPCGFDIEQCCPPYDDRTGHK